MCITMQGKPTYSASFGFRAVSVYPRLYGTKQPMTFDSHLNVDLEIFSVNKIFHQLLRRQKLNARK